MRYITMLGYVLLLCTSVIFDMAVTSTTIHHPSSIPGNISVPQQVPPASNSTDSTMYRHGYGSYNESPPDLSSIKFKYDDNNKNTVQENLIENVIARGVLQFALQLDFALSSEDYRNVDDMSNVVFSPLSIASALTVLMLGAAGRTYTEIANVLGLAAGIDLVSRGDELHYHFGRFIKKVENYPDARKSTYVTMAGGVFVQDGFLIKERFANLSKDAYLNEVLTLDFSGHSTEARNVINKWVENRTYGHIPNILESPPPPSTKVIIASALYFNGAWESPFLKEQTAWRPFYVSGSQVKGSSEVVQVLMMVNGGDFPYYSDPVLGCQIVGLPYKDHSATMYLVLPNEPGYHALKRLQYKFTVNRLKGLADSATERTVIIAVPRMQLESTIYLKKALKILGINTLFEPFEADLSQISDDRNVASFINTDCLGETHVTQEQNRGVDNNTSTTNQCPEHTALNINTSTDEVSKKSMYQTDSVKQIAPKHIKIPSINGDSKISKNPGLYVDSVIHKVTIDVTESGTEAAAATVVSVTRDGSHKVVRFERPFLFFIRHEATGAILFWGTVVKPTPSRIMPSGK
ncbi:hypothetical protein B7P43_G02791 [Cryptotermes secundus]|uniref:Serpin domain-containing protein n=1 Tax=Cryptotermes secundus TaxID=105785 RepID=A0A2J7RSS5_9NEOP|nr:serine protease inhibitor 28Dc [Cryptotermes secundus]PNF43885.1 hypothetical protein B7P43_G02791 [Cryptotermes secundus]